jgi:hypothetical protein
MFCEIDTHIEAQRALQRKRDKHVPLAEMPPFGGYDDIGAEHISMILSYGPTKVDGNDTDGNPTGPVNPR